MVNRPVAGPCWVVYRRVASGSSVDYSAPGGAKYYLRSPALVEEFRTFDRTKSPPDTGGRPGTFSIFSVEPFLREVDAIAAALIIGGHVQRVEQDDNA